ncbi:MAG: PrsW family intramembrane metalloprotease, partial [Leptospira sp.]|nr:PrsW family intramembrane metalloprotease [Leptospira sp.]
YSFELSLWPLLMRTVTSLPLHILTGGIIGGYVLRYNLSNPKNFPVIQLFKGIILCLLLHGIYNIAVFRGTESLFLIPSILTFAFIFLEYTIVKSQGALPEFVMNLIGLKLDDYEIISRFKQYDAWLRNEQNSRYQKRISMFRKMETKNKIISLVFLFAGASFLIVYLVHPENIFKFFPDITNSEVISIFVYYPIFVAFNFLFRGKLNPDFFNYRVLKVPLIGSVTLDNGQTQASSLFYFISRKGMYVPYINDEPIPGKINFTIWVAGREFKNISGNIVWSSGAESREEGETGGVFCKFDRIYFGLLLFWKLKRINHDLRNLFEAVKQKIDGRHSRRQKR